MKQFVDRLMSLDPAASETLKVIAYFDTLMATNAGVESLLRGAAILSGTAAGYRSGTTSTRVGPDGSRSPRSGVHNDSWPTRALHADAFVWLERDGPPHANDAMVLERLALTLASKEARRSPSDQSAIEIAVNTAASAEDRATALSRLRIDAQP